MATIAQTRIAGLTVSLESMSDPSDPARGEWLDCYVSNGRDSGSLECVDAEGEFMNGDRVSSVALGRVRTWAEAHGYLSW